MTKTVRLSDEAFERLCLLKSEDESFSDVVNRMVQSYKDLRKMLDLPSASPGISWDQVDQEMRKADQKRVRELYDRPNQEK